MSIFITLPNQSTEIFTGVHLSPHTLIFGSIAKTFTVSESKKTVQLGEDNRDGAISQEPRAPQIEPEEESGIAVVETPKNKASTLPKNTELMEDSLTEDVLRESFLNGPAIALQAHSSGTFCNVWRFLKPMV